MLYQIIDPDGKYTPKETYTGYHPADLPKSYSKAGNLRKVLYSKSARREKKIIVIWSTGTIKDTQAAILARIFVDTPSEVDILFMTRSDTISKHFENLFLKVKRIKGTKRKKEKTFFEKLILSLQTRMIPDDDLLPVILKAVGDSDLHIDNVKLAVELNNMLYKTHTRYLAVAWAGLHRPERKKLRLVKSLVKKDEPLKHKKQRKQTGLGEFL